MDGLATNPVAIAAFNLLLLFLLKCLALTLGFLCVRLGAQLISSGAKGEFKFLLEAFGGKTTLASFSPGLLFVLLGVLLMAYAVGVNKIVTIRPGVPGVPAVPIPELQAPSPNTGERRPSPAPIPDVPIPDVKGGTQ